MADFDLIGTLHKIVEKMDRGKICAQINVLKEQFPQAGQEDLCHRMLRNKSFASAIAGAKPSLEFLSGDQPDLEKELLTLLHTQSAMVLGIAYVFGYGLDGEERVVELAGCFGATCGAVAGAEGIKELVRAGLSDEISREIARKYAATISKSLGAKMLPLIGAVVAGIADYASVQNVGKVAINYYKAKRSE